MTNVSLTENNPWRSELLLSFRKLVVGPLLIILFTIGLHNIYRYYLSTNYKLPYQNLITIMEGLLYEVFLAACMMWLLVRLINQVSDFFLTTEFLKKHHIVNMLILSLTKICKGILFLMIFNVFVQHLSLPGDFYFVFKKTSSILIILASGWVLFQIIIISEQLLLHKYTTHRSNGLMARKMVTQLLILKRIAFIVIGILVAGSILMLFDNVKALGASVLTTAGIIGLVMTFTAQRTLSGLFSGLEIALTQPIKIGDCVVIQNEFGVIEEINFRNVIVKLWDWRRLIVPTNFFLENPFQNWSREESNNLIGTVYLYVDYTLPVEILREELKKILQASTLWDGNINTIQVNELHHKVMQLRVLSSADSPAKVWDLRCEVREKLISFIAQKYPECLPTQRTRACKENQN